MSIKLGLVLLLLCFYGYILAGECQEEEWMPEIIQQVTKRKAAPLALYADKLPQIPKIYAYRRRGRNYFPVSLTIGMYQTQMKFHRDLPPTAVFAYGTSAATATFPGPTIEAVRFTPTFVTWKNYLPPSHILPVDLTIAVAVARNGGVPAVVHLHGGVIAPDSDGSAFAWYTANYTNVGPAFSKYTYTYPNVQHSGNLMYHDHALGLTRVNLLAGLLGAYVIRDPMLDFSLNLPQGDEFDQHLFIADRSFLADGSIYMNPTGVNPDIHPVWRPEYFGDAITVNGKVWPYLNVQPRKYRFRITNVCNARYLDLSFSVNGSNPLPFVVVGSDSSYLPAPVTTTSILASVAETFDIIFDFSAYPSKEIELTNTAPYPYPNGTVIDAGSKDSKVMKFIVSPTPTLDPSTIPSRLVNYEQASPSDATFTRYIAMYEYFSSTNQTTHLYINGKRLTDPATETPNPGSTELWNVINLTGDNHPLHLHLSHFQAIKMQEILDLDNFTNCMQLKADPLQCNITGLATGKTLPIPDYEKTWKNVVKIPPGWMTTVIVKFKLVDSIMPYPFDATMEPGYVYHCHILDHEDNEMIRPLKLVKKQ